MNIFEEASKRQLTFKTSKGTIYPHDLWNLSLQNLDTIARGLNKTLKEAEEVSFITTSKSTANKDLNLSFEIVKHIIQVKLVEQEKSKLRAEKRSQAAFIKDLIQKKEMQEWEGKSLEELKASLEKESVEENED